MKVTLAALRKAAGMTLAEVLEQDYRVAVALTERPDLKEGIRAQVIDKDRNPQWSPATLAEVSDVLADADIRQGIKDFSDWPTIPQLYVKGEFLGGADIITEMFQQGELQQHLEGKGITVRQSA